MEGATAGAKRCFEVLDRQDDVVESPNAVAIESAQGAIGFRDVSFGYAEDRHVLHDVDLAIAPNQIVALVGGTGAGKSTLLSLVPRFYDPSAGSVTLDQRDVRAITKRSLRAQIGIVLQDTLLFSTTVRENIAYARTRPRTRLSMQPGRRRRMISFARWQTDTPAWLANAADI
jgi:ABC-type multidrug transport system fused ATPase/permease subunit